jgi:hypothetical protein
MTMLEHNDSGMLNMFTDAHVVAHYITETLLQIWLINKDFTSGEEILDMKRNMKYVLHLV